MNPKKFDDFEPLLNLDENELKSLVKKFNDEENEIQQKNRIYYLSEVLKVNDLNLIFEINHIYY